MLLNTSQNGINYATHMLEAGEIISVQSQVGTPLEITCTVHHL